MTPAHPRRAALPPLALMLLLASLSSQSGCTTRKTALRSEQPTYSYLHDDDAVAQLALWPNAESELSLAEIEEKH